MLANPVSGDEVLSGSIHDWKEFHQKNALRTSNENNNYNFKLKGEQKLLSATASTNVNSFELSKILS